ncbi:YdcF family protein [Aneurinibacillus aneurinilyticus]|uniref:YdcF family protein n=1 Tax=Aneurinibacillus aneurinilyticus TaxID=1391 RepID=UPI0030B8602C
MIFTGGKGRPNALPESTVARKYALAQGIPAHAILTEEQSRITEENLVYAKQLAGEHKLQTFLVVSDPLHMKRAVRMAQDLGMQAEPSPTTTSRYIGIRSQLAFLSRETFNYLGYCFVHTYFLIMRRAVL